MSKISISRDEWNEGKIGDALITRILQLLSKDMNKVWSTEGIRAELFGSGATWEEKFDQTGKIHRILVKLVAEGSLEARQIEMEDGLLEYFYALKQET